MTSVDDVIMTSHLPNFAQNNSNKWFAKSIRFYDCICNQHINSRYSTTAADSRRCHLVISLCLVMSYCSVLSSAAKLTKWMCLV